MHGKNIVPYIRLSMRHVYSINSTLKPCIKSMRVNISRNPNENFSLYNLQDCVKFTPMQFSQLWYSHEHSGKRMHAEKVCLSHAPVALEILTQTYVRFHFPSYNSERKHLCDFGSSRWNLPRAHDSVCQ